MKLSRITAVLTAPVLCVLAACGGGGGGATPPTNSGGGPPPVSTPTPSPGATATPTAKPTATPTAKPTATPSATPTSTPSIGVSSTVVKAEENFVNGDNSWYTSGTASWAKTAGGTASAPTGPLGSTFDGTTCQSVTEGATYPQTDFSQHAYVGIYFNGTWEALPQAIGMVNPVAPTQGNPSHPNNNDAVENNDCEYNVHVHDYSGLIHIEDESMQQSNTAMPSYATLQTVIDLWGAQLNTATGITAGSNTLTGPVTIYKGTPSGKAADGDDLVNSYTLFTGQPSALQFSKHMAVWIVIGAPPAAGLPQVDFVTVN